LCKFSYVQLLAGGRGINNGDKRDINSDTVGILKKIMGIKIKEKNEEVNTRQ